MIRFLRYKGQEEEQKLEVIVEHNTILRNLGYKGELKVFVEIQRNQYNPYHVNRCVEVEHGKDSIDFQSIGDN